MKELGATFEEAFKVIKKAAGARAQNHPLNGRCQQTMKMSHEKIIQISHRIMGAIEALDEVEIFEEPNTIRQEIVKILTELMHEEEKIDEVVKARIASQKRTIPEGSGRMGNPLPEILQRRTAQARNSCPAPPPHY